MFVINLLPANHGDCIWIEYGTPEQSHSILIDGGPAYAYPHLRARLQKDLNTRPKPHIDLMVITHVDADHIGGILEFLRELPFHITIGDVWFNGWHHFPAGAADEMGPLQGEHLAALLRQHRAPWNTLFDGKAVVVPDGGDLPRRELPGGMVLTLLSPTPDGLSTLQPKWRAVLKNAGLGEPSLDETLEKLRTPVQDEIEALEPPVLNVERLLKVPFAKDTSPANGSSIAFLAEYEGKSCLFAGDAFPHVLVQNVKRLCQHRDIDSLAVNALKVAHHGGQRNLSIELLNQITCSKYLFSTNGRIFGHPHHETIARIVGSTSMPKDLYFNYPNENALLWRNDQLCNTYGFSVHVPTTGAGISVEL
jgi:beta-lactamase superfamily II metal-dependent hydrolase